MNFRYKKASDILSAMVDNTLVSTNKVNDFTVGSVLRTLYEAVAIELEMYYYLNIENIKNGIEESVLTAFDMAPLQAKKAYGQVTLFFQTALANDLTIPIGAKVTSSDVNYDQSYETLSEYTVSAGSTNVVLEVFATQAGTQGNIPANVLDTITNINGIRVCTNLQPLQGGSNEEPTSETLIRFRKFIQSLAMGTSQAIEYRATTVGNITGAYIDENIGYLNLFAHDANGDLTDEDAIALRAGVDEWRPAGIAVNIFPVNKTLVDMYIKVDLSDGSLASDKFTVELAGILVGYMSTYTVSQNLYLNEVVQKVMNSSASGINNVDITMIAYPDKNLRSTTQTTPTNSIFLGKTYLNKDYLRYVDTSKDTDYTQTVRKTYPTRYLTPVGDITTTNPVPFGDDYGEGIVSIDNAQTNSSDDLGTDVTNVGVVINREYVAKANELIRARKINIVFS